jgi:hypothetical protein
MKIILFPAAICAPGEILEPCAFKCGDLCDNMAQLVDTCKQTTDTCVPLCRPAKHTCAPGEKLKDKITCVQQSMCPCRKQDGTIAKVNCYSKLPQIKMYLIFTILCIHLSMICLFYGVYRHFQQYFSYIVDT